MEYKFNNLCQVNFTFITNDGIIISKKTNVILTMNLLQEINNLVEFYVLKKSLADYIGQCINNKIFFNYSLIDNEFEKVPVRHVIRTKNLFAHLPTRISHVFLNDTNTYCLELVKNYVIDCIHEKYIGTFNLMFSDIIQDDETTYIKPVQLQLINENFFDGGRCFVKLYHDSNFRTTCLDCSNGVQAFYRIVDKMNNSIFVKTSSIDSDDVNSLVSIINYDGEEFLISLNKSVYKIISIDDEITTKNLIKWIFNQATFEFSLGHVSAIELSIGVNDSLKMNINEL